ncbi:MAG: hypothetical protein L0H64_19815, partial [Pseudonocardia sp.]|nr:hypothetical protein [Pseudonocardia sp.]
MSEPTSPPSGAAASRTGPANAGPDVDWTAETPWRRLDRRMLVVGPLGSLGRLLPLVVILLVTGGGADPVRVWVAVAAAGAVVLAGVARWRTTQYRITGDRV